MRKPWLLAALIIGLLLTVVYSLKTSQISFAQSAKNYTPYTKFTFPNGTYEDMTIYTKWVSVPSSASIYAAYDFSFKAGAEGYMGTQIYNGAKKAVFSIWDATGHPQTAHPKDTWCRRFDHEGLGSQCIIDYSWVQGRDYKLEMHKVSVTATSSVWEAFITDTVTGTQTKIGSHELDNINQFEGFGSLNSNPVTFHEYFLQPTDTCELHEYSKVEWRGPYVNQGQVLATNASTWYNDCTLTNTTSPQKGTTIVEEGPGTTVTNPNNTVLWDAVAACKEGDANGDGSVSLVDYQVWRNVYKTQ